MLSARVSSNMTNSSRCGERFLNTCVRSLPSPTTPAAAGVRFSPSNGRKWICRSESCDWSLAPRKMTRAENLPLTTELYETLAMQKSIRDAKFPACSWVFFNEGGHRIGRFQRSWRTACSAAGIVAPQGEPDRLFHDLRRSGVRNLIRAGVPEAVAMRISGHKTRSVFERYNIVSERDLHEAARKLETYVAGKTNPTQPGHTLGTPTTNSVDPSGSLSAKLLN